MKKGHLTLSIETAIQGGSVSVLDAATEIDFWYGDKAVSRSEDLLGEISRIFIKNDLKNEDIALIAVSRGIGSYTGLRIGVSTALGLKKAFGCEIRGVSALSAISVCAVAPHSEGSFGVAVAVNKRDIYARKFVKTGASSISAPPEPELFNFRELLEWFRTESRLELFVNEDLFVQLNLSGEIDSAEKSRLHNCGRNLAKFVGMAAYANAASDNDLPLYGGDFNSGK